MVQDSLVIHYPFTITMLASIAKTMYSNLTVILTIVGGVSLIIGLWAWFKVVGPCVILLRNCLYADRQTPWGEVYLALVRCFRHGIKRTNLYKAVRLHVELQLLKPRPIEDRPHNSFE